jgi:hypothetical protein
MDSLKQLRIAIQEAYPDDLAELTYIRQLGTLEGIIRSLMHESSSARKVVDHMITHYQKQKVT